MSPLEIVYVLIGLATIAPVFALNRGLFGRGAPALAPVEAVLYAVGLAALLVGWYFNFQYFRQYGDQAGWWHWTMLLFVNPASASGGQDLIFANLILFPLYLVVDGRRDRMRAAWWYFVMSLLTSYAFAWALFLAVQHRQRRCNARAPAG
jgi:hypothetical protein